MYKNILVPLDCSEVDLVIIKHLMELCECISPEISLMHVIHTHTRDSLKYTEKEAMDYLEKFRKEFMEKGIETNIYIEFGDPDKVIVRKAGEIGCDLIAFAAHGHKRLLDFLLGSVVEKVRHSIKVPVLVINAS